jgi:D-alanine-D-alanine ligase
MAPAQRGMAAATHDRPGQSSDALRDLQRRLEALKPHLRLAVIFAGNKLDPGSVMYRSPNSRAWKSYEAVAHDIVAALKRLGFAHVEIMPDDMRLGDRLRRSGIHMAWLNTGGVQGYNPAAHAPAMLEMFGLPYVGHDPLATSLLDNKHAFKHQAMCSGLPTAPFITWNIARAPFRADGTRFSRTFGDYRGPFVVKPVSGRASVHVHYVPDVAGLATVVADVYEATQNLVLIEKYLSGREFCVAVTGPVTARKGLLVRHPGPFSFAALERLLDADEQIFTSMDVRPITAARFRAPDPRRDRDLIDKLHRIARRVFVEFDLRSLIRVDLRTDEHGELHILETNPKPDLKQSSHGVTSLISAGLAEVGMDYDDLILSLLADRLDFLFTYRRGSVEHILDLIGRELHPTQADRELALDAGVLALGATLEAARLGEAGGGFAQGAERIKSLGSQVEKASSTVPQQRAQPPGSA